MGGKVIPARASSEERDQRSVKETGEQRASEQASEAARNAAAHLISARRLPCANHSTSQRADERLSAAAAEKRCANCQAENQYKGVEPE